MKLSDYNLEKMYKSFLDECYPDCKIAGYSYQTSRALEEIDPTAFRCGFNDWLDAEIKDGNIFEKGDEYFDSDPEDEV